MLGQVVELLSNGNRETRGTEDTTPLAPTPWTEARSKAGGCGGQQPPRRQAEVGQEVGQRWTGQKLQKEMAEERQRRGQDRPRLGKTGPRWGQNGPKMGPLWSKMEPRWAKMGPRWRQDRPRWSLDGTRRAKIEQDGPTEVAKTVQDRA